MYLLSDKRNSCVIFVNDKARQRFLDKKKGENSYSCGLYLYGLYVLNSKLNEEFGYYSTSTSMSKTHYDTKNKKKDIYHSSTLCI